MPSPFPGMDPYLEGALWPDVHATLIVGIRAALVAKLPTGYFANIDQYLWLGEGDEDSAAKKRSRRGKPDTFVTNGRHGKAEKSGEKGVAVAVANPTLRVKLPNSTRAKRKRYIRLIDAGNRHVVTVIELLSPSDKLPKQDRDRYLAKRAEYLGARVNLLEIDLLRKGHRVPMGTPEPPDSDYSVLVSRAADFPDAGYWPLTIRDALPTIPIPLDPGVADVRIALQPCLERALEQGRYEEEIDYTQPAPPPEMNESDRAWMRERIERAFGNNRGRADE